MTRCKNNRFNKTLDTGYILLSSSVLVVIVISDPAWSGDAFGHHDSLPKNQLGATGYVVSITHVIMPHFSSYTFAWYHTKHTPKRRICTQVSHILHRQVQKVRRSIYTCIDHSQPTCVYESEHALTHVQVLHTVSAAPVARFGVRLYGELCT